MSVYVDDMGTPPPEGWSTFGTNIEYNGPIEFSIELTEDGLPRWERISGGRE